MKSINVKAHIQCNTTEQKEWYAAEIDGRLWWGKNGKVLYCNLKGLKSALRQSTLWSEVVRPLADNVCNFRNISNPSDEREKVKEEMWKDFLANRVTFYKLHF